MIPHLLLDVDGVFIPFPDQHHQGPPSHTRHLVVPDGHDPEDPVPIWLNPDHGTLIRDLLDTGLLRPIWCTSWRHDANRLIAPLLGLPTLAVLDLPRPNITTSHPDGYLWKRDHVRTWADGQPLCWVDDDFTHLDHQWAAHRQQAGTPTLLVQPDPHIGLQPRHLNDVRAWAQQQARQVPRPRHVQHTDRGPETTAAEQDRTSAW